MLAAAGDDNYKYFVMGNPWTIFSNVVVVVFFCCRESPYVTSVLEIDEKILRAVSRRSP